MKPDKFKIWYIHHQVPGKAWEREVPDPVTGQLILDAIYDVALFLEANRMIIPDYANIGGICRMTYLGGADIENCLDEYGDGINDDPEDWEDEA